MTLNIKNAEADRLAHELAEKTGETLTETVIQALRERLMRLESCRSCLSMEKELMKIGRRCAALPDLDRPSVDEILGYNDVGIPGQ
jgi:antitoxin VapB